MTQISAAEEQARVEVSTANALEDSFASEHDALLQDISGAVSQMAPEQTGAQCAVIYDAKANRGHMGPLGLYYEINKPPAKARGAKAKEVELRNLILGKGTNFVSIEVWKKIEEHEGNKIPLKNLKRKRAIMVLEPDNPSISGCSLDFTHGDDILEVVENCTIANIDWLKLSINRDTRPNLTRLMQNKLRELEELKKNRRKAKADSTIQF